MGLSPWQPLPARGPGSTREAEEPRAKITHQRAPGWFYRAIPAATGAWSGAGSNRIGARRGFDVEPRHLCFEHRERGGHGCLDVAKLSVVGGDHYLRWT